jgi:tetratricopeptide (TPR) repeat protein
MAMLLTEMGRFSEARPLHERALAIDEKALGPEHPITATTQSNLAMLLHGTGSYAEALPLLERALAIRERALGPDSPGTAISLNNLAMVLDSQGRFAEARPLCERALAIDEKALGPDHPHTAIRRPASAGCPGHGRGRRSPSALRRAIAINEKRSAPMARDGDGPRLALVLADSASADARGLATAFERTLRNLRARFRPDRGRRVSLCLTSTTGWRRP